MFKEMFEASLQNRKGMMLYIKGQTVAGVVTKILDDNFIEMRNQEYDKIRVKVDSIDAAAMN